MIKRYIVTALVLIMLAPLNAGASVWMAESSSVVDADEVAVAQMHMAGHDHGAMMGSGQKHRGIRTHQLRAGV